MRLKALIVNFLASVQYVDATILEDVRDLVRTTPTSEEFRSSSLGDNVTENPNCISHVMWIGFDLLVVLLFLT